jgi:hypothetical protein
MGNPTKIKPSDIDLVALAAALPPAGGAIVSEAVGDLKKVTKIQFNPSTGELIISYEE